MGHGSDTDLPSTASISFVFTTIFRFFVVVVKEQTVDIWKTTRGHFVVWVGRVEMKTYDNDVV